LKFDLDEIDTQALDADTGSAGEAVSNAILPGSIDDGVESTKELNVDDNFDLLFDDQKESTASAALDLDLDSVFAGEGVEAFPDDTMRSMLPDGVQDDDAGTMHLQPISDSGLSAVLSDQTEVSNPDDEHASTARISDDDLAAMGLSDSGPEEMTMAGGITAAMQTDDFDEVATKLDLARAYVEMEDPDNAKSILQEVIAEGNDGQRSEAQDILLTLS